MVVLIVADLIAKTVSSYYFVPLIVGLTSLYYLKVSFSGKKTDRERDLHGRTILLTGATSSLGLTIIAELARRGAQVVAVVPDLGDPNVLSLLDVVRHTTNNELVYAEQCNLSSPGSIKDFCARLVKSTGGGLDSEPPRLDAVVFAHEYAHVGAVRGTKEEKQREDVQRLHGRLATFFFTTLLLPILLTAPQERDIRFINVVSPFYGAAIPSYDPKTPQEKSTPSIWIEEGRRSLETIVFTRHFQRILDALPSPSIQTRMSTSNRAPSSSTLDAHAGAVEAVAAKRPSNILVTAVSPGISRWDTVAPFMRADNTWLTYSLKGMLSYIILSPIIYLFAKSSNAAVQTVLHALFLPSPFKASAASSTGPSSQNGRVTEEYVQGGALYAECERVQLPGNSNRLESEEGGQRIWEYLEGELAAWRKSEESKSGIEKESPKK